MERRQKDSESKEQARDEWQRSDEPGDLPLDPDEGGGEDSRSDLPGKPDFGGRD